jgi:hypothetical protein
MYSFFPALAVFAAFGYAEGVEVEVAVFLKMAKMGKLDEHR